MYARPRPKDPEAMARARLEQVGLGDRLGHTPQQLSGGQQQRVAIARALVGGPQILLADEPTGALDTRTAKSIMRLLDALNAEGLTVVLVTHEGCGSHARRRIVLRDGRVVEDAAQAQARPATRSPSRPAPAMTLLDLLETALRAIATNTLRSALTTLGIVIGVASVIVMGAVGAGARAEIDRQIANLGARVLVILPKARVYGARTSENDAVRPLTEDDIAAVESQVAGVAAISGQLWASTMVVRGNANMWTFVWGVHDQYLVVRNWALAAAAR